MKKLFALSLLAVGILTAAPTLTNCGTSPTLVAGASDNSAIINIGHNSLDRYGKTIPVLNCTVTFGTPFGATPPILVSGFKGGLSVTLAPGGVSTTRFIASFSSDASQAQFSFGIGGVNGATGATGPTGATGAAGVALSQSVTCNAACVLALNATPLTLVTAVAAKVINVIGISVIYHYVSTDYTGSGNFSYLYNNNASAAAAQPSRDVIAKVLQDHVAGDLFRYDISIGIGAPNIAPTDAVNKPVTLISDGAYTLGNGTLTITTFYTLTNQ